jgi:hypothetical protein
VDSCYFGVVIRVRSPWHFFSGQSDDQGHAEKLPNGKYVVIVHGEVVRSITESEFLRDQTDDVKLFSGLWIVFYSLSLAVLSQETREE